MTDKFKLHRDCAARNTPARPAQRAGRVSIVKVPNWDSIYEYALNLANGDPSRVTVTSAGEVIVRNKGKGE